MNINKNQLFNFILLIAISFTIASFIVPIASYNNLGLNEESDFITGKMKSQF